MDTGQGIPNWDNSTRKSENIIFGRHFGQWYSDTIGMTSGFGTWRKSEKIGKILTNLFVDNFVQDNEIGD